MFTGHGSQYQDMGAGLHAEEPVFRDAFDRCADLLATDTGLDLGQVFGPTGADGTAPLDTMTLAQPAVFAIEYAMAQLWRSWGITPEVVVGHSVGEYVAAVDAGVMSLADGLRLVATRGRLMDTLPPGAAMATILASEAQVAAMIGQAAPQVSVAAVNGPTSVAVSGSPADVETVLDAARAAGIEVRPLDIPVAAHSPQVEPILDEFERVAATVTYHQPATTVVSGLTGAAATGDDLITAGYWRRHLRQPVRFADAFVAVHGLGARAFIETGPHPTLINMGRHIVDETPDLDPADLVWLPSLRRGRHDLDVVLGSLGQFYTAGGSINWPAVVGDRAPGGDRSGLPVPAGSALGRPTGRGRGASRRPPPGRQPPAVTGAGPPGVRGRGGRLLARVVRRPPDPRRRHRSGPGPDRDDAGGRRGGRPTGRRAGRPRHRRPPSPSPTTGRRRCRSWSGPASNPRSRSSPMTLRPTGGSATPRPAWSRLPTAPRLAPSTPRLAPSTASTARSWSSSTGPSSTGTWPAPGSASAPPSRGSPPSGPVRPGPWPELSPAKPSPPMARSTGSTRPCSTPASTPSALRMRSVTGATSPSWSGSSASSVANR